jgi:hypothetical protein
MLHYAGGHPRPVTLLALPHGSMLRITDLAAAPSAPLAIGVGGINPRNCAIGGYSGDVILAHRN